MKKILNYLFAHQKLTKKDAEEVLTKIARGEYSEPEIAAFITVYLMRGVSVEELSGFRDALLNLCIPVNLSDFDPMDLCGTGGDEKNTFNISTLSTFVVAGAGARVAKHGNYSVSSSCGSSNILEYYGYKFTNNADDLKKQIEKCNICFLHAPLFNPAMKNIAPVRKALKVKTFFNMLGPMVNPTFPKKQMVGVFSLDVARLYNYIYQQSDKNFAIIYSLDGYDEISLTCDFKVYSNRGEFVYSPSHLGFKTFKQSDIFGGNSVEEAAKIFINILEGNGTEAQKSVVLANSAMALSCYYPEKTFDECLSMASESLISKKALQTFKNLISL